MEKQIKAFFSEIKTENKNKVKYNVDIRYTVS